MTRAGSRSDALIQSEDYYPTLLAGLSLRPAPGQRFGGLSHRCLVAEHQLQHAQLCGQERLALLQFGGRRVERDDPRQCDLRQALDRAYGAVEAARFEGAQWRTDIARRALNRA